MAPSRRLVHVDRLILAAEKKYDQASFARALAALEDLGADPGEPEVKFRKASIMHGLAELRGDLALLREARALYEEVAASGRLNPVVNAMMPELIEDCHAQEREALEERRGQ